MYNAAFLITMYDENKTVEETISLIRSSYGDKATIIVAHSKSDTNMELNVDKINDYIILPNLANVHIKRKLPAYAIARNYGMAFSRLYEKYSDIDYIVAITGDTFIWNISGIERLYTQMINNKKIMCVSQAIGQDFHSADSNPPQKSGGRFQFDGISDFMPQFFVVDGSFAFKTKVFSNIKITNEYCSEQCLGDELSNYIDQPFSKEVIVIAKNAYDFNDGIAFNYKK
jgi:hypothetical protein